VYRGCACWHSNRVLVVRRHVGKIIEWGRGLFRVTSIQITIFPGIW
jgi:hypothetical protein